MDIRQIRWMKVVLLMSSVASFVVFAAAAYRENFRGTWREAQTAYKSLLVQHADSDAERRSAESFTVGLAQVYLPDLKRIDRCTTCHLGVGNPDAADSPQPIRKHSGLWLEQHPIEKFGCTVCHQGRGRATEREAAHGWRADGSPVPYMETPLLRGEAVFTSCGRCHAEIDLFEGGADLFADSDGEDGDSESVSIDSASLASSLPMADMLTEGKRLVIKSGCLGCHAYRGRGGSLGTDLTYVGDKTEHDFDFTHVKGEHTVEQWLFEHFKIPQQVSPDTLMPDMGLSDTDARNLTLYMMSLHRKDAPASHMPRAAHASTVGATVRGETLYAMFCSACHGSDGYGTTMRGGLWSADADPWGRDVGPSDVVVEQRSEIDVTVPSLNQADTLATVSDEYLRRIIAYGRPGTKMLGWQEEGGLSADEITLLVDHIRGWQQPPTDRTGISATRGDVRVGRALYRLNCAACHGSNGEGGIGNSLNAPTFLAAASDGFLRDTIVFGRPNTAMPAWREFDAQEIGDLIAYLRSFQPRNSDVETVLAMTSGPETRDVKVRYGEIFYKTNCLVCHGENGVGDLGPSINTQAFLTAATDEYISRTMIEGRPNAGMPSWGHLSNEDVASIVRFIRKWQSEPSKSQEWRDEIVRAGDWDAGRHLFAGQCGGCHGPDGEGAVGPQLMNPQFLDVASDAMLRDWISYGKEGTAMRPFLKGKQGVSELTERQIEDIIAYMRFRRREDVGKIVTVAKAPTGRAEKGAVLYGPNCSGCHGERGQGGSGPALSNSNFLKYASDGFIIATMAIGRTGTEMRPVKKGPSAILTLSSDEVNDVLAFLRSWEHSPPFGKDKDGIGDGIPHRFVAPTDLAQGKELWGAFCSGCHGTNGKGMWAPELNNEGFLAAATDGFLQATIVRGRKGTAMRPFGTGGQGMADLTTDQIDNIVSYIRQWSSLAPIPTSTGEASVQPQSQPDSDAAEVAEVGHGADSVRDSM